MHDTLHHYRVDLRWTGNLGSGTETYGGYRRDHRLEAEGRPPIEASSDPKFRGDPTRWNPEELLVAALSSCHQLSYLALCARAGIAVLSYEDRAEGIMQEAGDGGAFSSVVLRPRVVLRKDTNLAEARRLHHRAHELCYIASSVNFSVECAPLFDFEIDERPGE